MLPLLEVTLAQAAAYTADVWLAVPPDEPGPYEALASAYGARVHRAPSGCRNEFESTRLAWSADGVNVLLLGDVYFTDAALACVFGRAAEGFRFFGRFGASRITGTTWGEIFAQSWTDSAEMGRLTDEVRAEQDAGRADPTKHGWTMLRLLQDTPLREHAVYPPWWVEIDDATDDIDFPDDYRRHPASRGLDEEGAACA
ncbi:MULTISPECIES: hypothetical protein [unclassified Streptomyces]|uniref:hypothetical protein n=1 Tax=unclassified Streptomyces TaxID=2593676 RepID=UPI002FF10EBD